MSPVSKGYRPRATTESGHRPARVLRQHTADEANRQIKKDNVSSAKDAEVNEFDQNRFLILYLTISNLKHKRATVFSSIFVFVLEFQLVIKKYFYSMDLDSESREKGLPTIFKYSGTGNEVYVCGELMSFIFFPFIREKKILTAMSHCLACCYKFNVFFSFDRYFSVLFAFSCNENRSA